MRGGGAAAQRLNELIAAGLLPKGPEVKTIATMVDQAIAAGVDITIPTGNSTDWFKAMSEPYSKYFSGNAYGYFGESCPADLSTWRNIERDNAGIVLENSGNFLYRIDSSVITRSNPKDINLSDIIKHRPDRLPDFERLPNNEPGNLYTPDKYISTANNKEILPKVVKNVLDPNGDGTPDEWEALNNAIAAKPGFFSRRLSEVKQIAEGLAWYAKSVAAYVAPIAQQVLPPMYVAGGVMLAADELSRSLNEIIQGIGMDDGEEKWAKMWTEGTRSGLITLCA